MLSITIDHKTTTVPEGATILEAARKLGLDIPTLCFLDDIHDLPDLKSPDSHKSTSCLVCLVKNAGRMVPACATYVTDGMVVESETDEIKALRQTSLELLLSDHVGDCFAPCQFACPARMDIPRMLRFIAKNDMLSAIQTVKEHIALPAVLGRVCPKPCEKICRRKGEDEPVSICQLKRYVGDSDLGSANSWIPQPETQTGKRVAVIGAGVCGLSAAYHLSRFGHEVVLLEKKETAGGRLRNLTEDILPKDVLDAEIEQLLRLPISTQFGVDIDLCSKEQWSEVLGNFDAVLLAIGKISTDEAESLGFLTAKTEISVVSGTYNVLSTGNFTLDGVFAAGTVVRGSKSMIVRSVADGRESAEVIDRFLITGKTESTTPLYSVRIKKLDSQDLFELIPNGSRIPRDEPTDAGTDEYEQSEAVAQANRCLHCDCRGRNDCKLLKYSEKYDAKVDKYQADSPRRLLINRSGNILFEPGKCIKCGLCITITKASKQLPGLAFVGRGFDVKIGVPFDGTFEEALGAVARECVQACPTAAIVLQK